MSKHAKAHVYLPADRLPVAAGRAELRRLRAVVAIGARDAERGDARVASVQTMPPRRKARRLLLLRRRAHQSKDRLVHLIELTASVGVECLDAALERGEFSRQHGVRRQ